MRVNARFEGIAEQQVAYLASTTGMSISEVLRLSVQTYYDKVRCEAPTLAHFGKHIGRYNSGRSDNSVRYKQVLSEAFDKKFPRTDKGPE